MLRLRTGIIATAVLAGAAALWVGLTLPPPTIALDVSLPTTRVSGAYHIHTLRSDGSGSPEEVAEAARRAGLGFVILTDHGDATRAPDPPVYRDGVLVIDAAEINTNEGHVVALGLTAASAFPLAGPARDVIEDIHRMGGAAVLAHPDSPKSELRWRGMNLPFDGIEWLNADSEWRDDPPMRLVASAVRSLVRPAEAIATLFTRPVRTLQRWDTAARQRSVFGLAAVDAHARIGWRESEEPRQRTAVKAPSYEAMFRTLLQTVILPTPFTGHPAEDAAAVLTAVRAGQSYSVVRAFAHPANLEFRATQGKRTVTMGGSLPAGVETIFHASVVGAPGANLVLLKNGRRAASGQGSVSLVADREPGAYRVEVTLPQMSMPWIVSNPIVVEETVTAPITPEASTQTAEFVLLPAAETPWTIERDPASTASWRVEDGGVRLDYQMSGGPARGQYVALVTPGEPVMGVDAVEFVARASGPMRLSVQARFPGASDEQRWRYSVYLDQTARPVMLRLQDFAPVPATSRRPIVAPVQSLLFVVDTVNSRPGTHGSIWISRLRLRRGNLPEPPSTSGR